MLGGHIEPGETIEEALLREAQEEGGFTAEVFVPYGYIKVIAKEPAVNDHHGGTYPPISYIPHFIALTDAPLSAATGTEVLESRAFSIKEITRLKSAHEPLILAGLKKYPDIKTRLNV